MFSTFFINRPIFASVLSIVIVLAGMIAVFALPIAQYPEITPPTVEVSALYPGANSETVADTVAAPIEQQVNGVENMLYMSSQCTNDGSYTLTITFRIDVDLNMAQVLVQNRVALAEPILPDLVKRRGVTVKKKSPSILMIVNLYSPDLSRDNLYLSNYATIQLRDELARLKGVGDITYLGQRDYSMRVWLDPGKMSFRNLTSTDVVSAIEQQNIQVAAGQIGQPPVPSGQVYQYTMSTLGRLADPDQFGDMVLKTDVDGRVVRLKDVARIEQGAQSYDQTCTLDGRPSVALSIYQRPGSNALETAKLVREKMDELKGRFYQGLDYTIVYDTTPFITESVTEVFKTLRDAIILVAVVVLLFLQNWRSAIIPLIAVPVAIVGTFAVMAALGYSLNNLTLFGLVLAIGIVVDDAIVVVEAVEHHIEHGLNPREATVRAMQEVSGPVIAIGLVLSAVFVPCAFITGIVGQFFRQFALTIAASTIISTFNSLTLSPALAALMLRPRTDARASEPLPRLAFAVLGGWLGWEYLGPRLAPSLIHALAGSSLPIGPLFVSRAAGIAAAAAGLTAGWLVSRLLNRLFGGFFVLFNAGFRAVTGGYVRLVGGLLRVSILVLLVYGGLLYLTYDRFTKTPKGFVPSADMGYLLVNVQLPDSASAERTRAVMGRLEQLAHAIPGVKHSQAMSGMSLLLSANGSNFGSMFLILDSFDNRRHPELYGEALETARQRLPELYGKGEEKIDRLTADNLSGDAIAGQLRKVFDLKVPDAVMTVLGPPPVRGVGRAGGFKLMVEDRGDNGSRALEEETSNLVETARVRYQNVPEPAKRLVGMISVFRANVPQLFADVDRQKCMTKEIRLQDLFDTLRIYLGSLYVNDFNRFGRTWQVIVQADAKYRNRKEGVRNLKVRNKEGKMVPIGAVADINEINGPLVLTRYNMYPAAPINGSAAPGTSTGTAIKLMDDLAAENLLPTMKTEWTELAFLELQAGNTAMFVFGFAVVAVFLVLAAQYESWAFPLAIILVVPMCLLSAIVGVNRTKGDINIFTQIGFVVLVGLASKNAILIVEFAKMRREQGEPPFQATLDACRLRLRPIVMTSFAFILGVVPLITSRGAGAEMRRILGVTVFSGMLGVTLFGIFLTPVFFYVIDRASETRFFRSRGVHRAGTFILYALLIVGLFPFSALFLLYRYLRRELVKRPRAFEVGDSVGEAGGAPFKPSPDQAEELVPHK